jgi:hypothetical protein
MDILQTSYREPGTRGRSRMILRMLRCLTPWLMAMFPLVLIAQGKSTNPVPAYKMRIAEKRSKMATFFVIAPDQSLLFFTGDQGGDWNLRRVSGWDSSSPKQERLKLTVPSHEDMENSRFGESTFLLTNDGQFALTRVALDATGTASSFGKNSRAIVNIIDLQSFAVVSTLNTTDKLLADGFWWAFESRSILAEYGANEKDSAGNPFTRESIALLEVPTLKPSMECDYLRHYGEPKQDDHGGISRTTSTSDLSSGCAEMMHKMNASGPEHIAKLRTFSKEAQGLKFQPLEFSGNPAWDGCSLVDERSEDKLALFDCSSGHQTWYDTSKLDSRAFFAVDLPTGKVLLRVPVSSSKGALGHLTTHEGKPWLALLTDHVYLGLYPIR